MNADPPKSSEIRNTSELMRQIQSTVLNVYGCYDRDKSLLWLVEEVGELSAAIRKEKPVADVKGEMGDVLAWVLCMINILGFDAQEILHDALRKELNRQERKYGSLKYWQKSVD